MRRREILSILGGAAAGWPLGAQAQPPDKPVRIGYLALLADEDATLAKPFLQRLQELGYVAGKTMVLDYRSADGKPEALAPAAASLLQAGPNVLVAGFGTLAAKAAAAATVTVPVVFTSVGDPVAAGLVASLAQPGANVTGMSGQANELAAKQLQILASFLPGQRSVAVIANPDTPFTVLALHNLRAAAEQWHRTLAVFEARTSDEVLAGLDAAIKADAGALLTLDDPVLIRMGKAVAERAAAAKLPAMAGNRDFAEAGGLMSFGPDQREIFRHAAECVDRILKGARPADLPVEQPTKFEFVVNLQTARGLGLTLPAMLLARADDVIE